VARDQALKSQVHDQTTWDNIIQHFWSFLSATVHYLPRGIQAVFGLLGDEPPPPKHLSNPQADCLAVANDESVRDVEKYIGQTWGIQAELLCDDMGHGLTI